MDQFELLTQSMRPGLVTSPGRDAARERSPRALRSMSRAARASHFGGRIRGLDYIGERPRPDLALLATGSRAVFQRQCARQPNGDRRNDAKPSSDFWRVV